MEYTHLGNTGLKVSRFGLGCMRFPKDQREAVQMVRYAIDNEVNYLDTAFVYSGSEETIGMALRGGYRNKVYLAAKSPVWNMHRHQDFEKYLDIELKRMGTDSIDVYLLHNLDPGNWKMVKRYVGLSFLDKMIAKGKIRHKAFSIHSTTQAFREIADAFNWDMAQIQLNILDETQQVGLEGLKYGAAKGMAMVVMEPLRGGYLLNHIPAGVQELVDHYPEKRSLVEWCFRWLYNMPEVAMILSGTSSLTQLKDNLRIFENSSPNVMTEDDLKFIHAIRDAYESQNSIGCTGCRYCTPCPAGVAIPEIFKLYNSYQIVKPHTIDKVVYKDTIVPTAAGADRCVNCGDCVKHCPQKLPIPELLKKVHAELYK